MNASTKGFIVGLVVGVVACHMLSGKVASKSKS